MRLSRFLRFWKKSEQGSVAIEFSMLALPFMYILIGTMEIGLIFASNSVLDGATAGAARLIRTGQVQQSGGDPQEMFVTKLCEQASTLIACSDLKIEVVEMDKFSDFSSYAPVYDQDGNPVLRGFAPGGVNSVNLIRVYYKYRVATPLIGRLLANGPDNSRMMISTVVLETEPYDFSEVAGQM